MARSKVGIQKQGIKRRNVLSRATIWLYETCESRLFITVPPQQSVVQLVLFFKKTPRSDIKGSRFL
jgi:hypothetical protein